MEMEEVREDEPPPIGFEGLAGQQTPPSPPSTNSTPTAAPAANGSNKDYQKLEAQENSTPHSITPDNINRGLFFNDGMRKIDYVMAFRESDEKRRKKRETFEENIKEEGLQLEFEDKNHSQDGKTDYIKVHAPWEVLTRYAEMMKIKMPIKPNDIAEAEVKNKSFLCKMLPNPFVISEDLLPEEPDFYTAAFNRDRADQFIIDDKASFFTNAQRSRIVYEILSRTKYDTEKTKNRFGVDRLVGNGSYAGAYPLHEGKYNQGDYTENERHLLYETWARPGRWLYQQPLDLIRKYFGEKVGIYFTWLGFYTLMLIPASIVGILCFIYGLVSMSGNTPSEEVCNSDIVMCPLCDKRCTYWYVKDSCDYSRVTYLFDNAGTVFFAIFMSMWATLFLEFWKRKQNILAWDWDVNDFEEEGEPVRPQYEAAVKSWKLNPVNQIMEPFLPFWNKGIRLAASGLVVLFMLCIVFAALLGVIIYRIVVVALLYQFTDEEIIRKNAKLTTTATSATINLVIIMFLSRIYRRIATFLTDLECPRTMTEYEDSFTFKMFLFMFVNYYSSLIYIAFFKGTFSSPSAFGDGEGNVFGQRPEECDPSGCIMELAIQLMIIMIGKQAWNNFIELVLPVLKNWWKRRSSVQQSKETENVYTRWEQDFDLAELPPTGLFDEYLEMVIQFGFITIFVAAFPLAPLFALLNNIIEVRLDAYKMVTQLRRPLARRAQDIGIWYGILNAVSKVAVIVNGFVIAYTSDFIPKLVYTMAYSKSSSSPLTGYVNQSLSVWRIDDDTRPDDPKVDVFGEVKECRFRGYYEGPDSPRAYEPSLNYWHIVAARLGFVVVFEHFIIFVTSLIAYLIPDEPRKVKIQKQRESLLAKEALYKTELQKSKKFRAEGHSNDEMIRVDWEVKDDNTNM